MYFEITDPVEIKTLRAGLQIVRETSQRHLMNPDMHIIEMICHEQVLNASKGLLERLEDGYEPGFAELAQRAAQPY